MLFILHAKGLVNCKSYSSVGRKCQEQSGLCSKTLICILNSKDREVLNRGWLTVCSLSAALNGEGSPRCMKRDTQAVVLAIPGFWVLRFTTCIAIWAKLILSGGKKHKEDKTKEDFSSRCLSDTHVGCQQGQNTFSLMLRHPELTESVAPTAAYQPLCQPYADHPRLFLLFFLSTPRANFRRGTPPRASPARAITPWLGFNASLPRKGGACCRWVLGLGTPARLMNRGP